MAIEFDREFAVEYGRVDEVSPLIRRVVAENPGRFTFTGTGTFIVGHGEVAVIDPGPLIPAHVDALLRAVKGETVTHIFITHTHGDHSPAAQPLKEATGAITHGFGPHPIADIEARRDEPWATGPAVAPGANSTSGEAGDAEPAVPVEERSDLAFVPDVVMLDGAVVRGGTEAEPWTIEALHTPGHISNHLCFALPEEKALFTGDHVMAWSTSVIPSPDGNLGHYLHHLARLLDRDDEVYWPTHGPPIRQPHPFVRELIAHREERTRQIIERLAAGDETIGQMVPVLYADVDPKLHPAAARSVLSHLVYLVETGQATAEAPDADTDSPGRSSNRAEGASVPPGLAHRWRLSRPG